MENNALSLQPFLVFPIMLRVIKMGRKRNDESTWQLVLLFFYSCTAVPATMFMLSLVFQWILVPGFDVDFFGYEQVYVALKIAVIGFFVGICLWLSYYLSYRKRMLNK